jgi:GntR family transcriptional regulator/MocR family aminotransferase
MSFRRRTDLIDFACASDAVVFEDDYNSEFPFTGPPLPCLQGLDKSGRMIYVGTMSKILYPSLRLSYLVVPEKLIDSMAKIRSVMDQHSPAIDQATLARFITEGFFLSHVKRMRKLYADRREFFLKEFNKLLSDRFILQIPEAGLNFVACFDPKQISRESCVSGPRSESNPHHYHFIASKRTSSQRLFSVLLLGRRHKFERVLLNSHPHSRQRKSSL